MNPETLDYVKHRMDRSMATLAEADFLLGGGFTTLVVNRIYYACFYAVSALLFLEGYSSSKHSGVRALFDRLWVKPGRLPQDMSKFYHLMFDRRQEGDYEEMPAFDESDVRDWLSEARLFVGAVSAWLKDNTEVYDDPTGREH